LDIYEYLSREMIRNKCTSSFTHRKWAYQNIEWCIIYCSKIIHRICSRKSNSI